MIENYRHIQELANADVKQLEVKGQSYGSSWRNRGGVGAFMMLARKWDRIENQCKKLGYDIFAAVEGDGVTGISDGILDDIQDLRGYLLLVESYCTAPKTTMPGPAPIPKNAPDVYPAYPIPPYPDGH